MFIYIHLPFCLSHCIYCDFYVELKATPERRQSYLQALKTEISHYLGSYETKPIQTLYFGGGTPALFSAVEIKEIIGLVQQFAPFSPSAEVTLEANPEGMHDEPQAYLQAGINRLSIGVQSVQANELKRLSRVHSVDQVYQFYYRVRQAGFQNISLDLMYGIPEQTPSSWRDTLDKVTGLGPEHISMYGLKVEENTRLERLLQQGRMSLPPDEETVTMYEMAVQHLGHNGYEAYEMSNLALPGKLSRHNMAYWDNMPFWGFGVSAHGYIQACRYVNAVDLSSYLNNPTGRSQQAPCTLQEQWENAFIFGLRKREGVYVPALEEQFGFVFSTCYGPRMEKFISEGYLTWQDGWLRLSAKAIPVSNSILSEFLLD